MREECLYVSGKNNQVRKSHALFRPDGTLTASRLFAHSLRLSSKKSSLQRVSLLSSQIPFPPFQPHNLCRHQTALPPSLYLLLVANTTSEFKTMADIFSSHPYPGRKTINPNNHYCAVCNRTLAYKDRAAHDRSKKHRAGLEKQKAKEAAANRAEGNENVDPNACHNCGQCQ